MQTAEFNHNDFSNTAEADKALMVKFFKKNVQNQMESTKQGRPIFKEKVYIEIRIAGQRDAQACRPVTHQDKGRFPDHWRAYQDRTAPPTEGMPLIEWGGVSRSQAEELAFLHIKTVEQLASVKDGNIQNFMGGYELRKKAAKWLETSNAETDDREKEELRSELDELKAQMAELLAAAQSPPAQTILVAGTSETLTGGLDEEVPAPEAEQPKAKPVAKPRQKRNAN